MKRPSQIKPEIDYNFSNAESQKLMEEFTVLLGEVVEYIDAREDYIKILEQNHSKMRIREMVSEIYKRFYKTIKKKILLIFKKIKAFIKK